MTTKLQEMAHDMNNVITLISLNSSLALKVLRTNSDKAESCLIKIFNSSTKMTEILETAMSENVETTDIGELLYKLVDDLESTYNMQIDIIEQHQLIKSIGRNSFERMVTNIVKNANEAKATKVKIGLSKTSIVFVDNGEGIADHVAYTLNTRDEMVTTKDKGHGIGTHYIKSFCNSLGWSVNFSSIKEKLRYAKSGTKIVIKL